MASKALSMKFFLFFLYIFNEEINEICTFALVNDVICLNVMREWQIPHYLNVSSIKGVKV